MNILGLDPGPEKTGWAIIRAKNVRASSTVAPVHRSARESAPDRVVRDYSIVDRCSEKGGKESNQQILHYIKEGYFAGIDLSVIESLTLYRRVNIDVRDTCLWVGAFAMALEHSSLECPIRFLTRSEVKYILNPGVPKPGDSTVDPAVRDYIGPKGTKKKPGPTFGVSGDTWAALAVAIAADREPDRCFSFDMQPRRHPSNGQGHESISKVG
jgi:hypothetical protein